MDAVDFFGPCEHGAVDEPAHDLSVFHEYGHFIRPSAQPAGTRSSLRARAHRNVNRGQNQASVWSQCQADVGRADEGQSDVSHRYQRVEV